MCCWAAEASATHSNAKGTSTVRGGELPHRPALLAAAAGPGTEAAPLGGLAAPVVAAGVDGAVVLAEGAAVVVMGAGALVGLAGPAGETVAGAPLLPPIGAARGLGRSSDVPSTTSPPAALTMGDCAAGAAGAALAGAPVPARVEKGARVRQSMPQR